jgi:hypothetical protein
LGDAKATEPVFRDGFLRGDLADVDEEGVSLLVVEVVVGLLFWPAELLVGEYEEVGGNLTGEGALFLEGDDVKEDPSSRADASNKFPISNRIFLERSSAVARATPASSQSSRVRFCDDVDNSLTGDDGGDS